MSLSLCAGSKCGPCRLSASNPCEWAHTSPFVARSMPHPTSERSTKYDDCNKLDLVSVLDESIQDLMSHAYIYLITRISIFNPCLSMARGPNLCCSGYFYINTVAPDPPSHIQPGFALGIGLSAVRVGIDYVAHLCDPPDQFLANSG